MDFQNRIKYIFKNKNLLRCALTHKSFVGNQRQPDTDNERFEFLGDAVLELVISHLIMDEFPGLREGEMTKLRASLVNERSLADIALNAGISEMVMLGYGEEAGGGRLKPSILADSLEAIIGAVYLDGGYEAAFMMIAELFSGYLKNANTGEDYKTMLQEMTQHSFRCIPEYRLKKTTGPDHCRIFHIDIYIKDDIYGSGDGKSKKKAEQAAAKVAFERLNLK